MRIDGPEDPPAVTADTDRAAAQQAQQAQAAASHIYLYGAMWYIFLPSIIRLINMMSENILPFLFHLLISTIATVVK